MIVICTKCQAKFRVADEKIGPRGAKVRCSRCQTIFLVHPDLGTMPLSADGSAAETAPPPARRLDVDLEAAAQSPDPFAPAAPDPFVAAFASSSAPPAAADPFSAPSPSPADPFAPAPGVDPFAPQPIRDDPFAPRATAPDGFAPPAAEPFQPPLAAPGALGVPLTDLSDLLGTATPAAVPRPGAAPSATAGVPDFQSVAAAQAPPASSDDGGLSLEERTVPPVLPPPLPSPAAAAWTGPGAEGFSGPDAFSATPMLDAGSFDFAAPGADEPLALAREPAFVTAAAERGAHVEAPPIGAPEPAPAPAAPPAPVPRRRAAAAPAPERIPDARASRLRAVAVNAVALAALLLVAVAILVVWRSEGPLDASALRPAAILAALGRGSAGPFVAQEIRSGTYERERGPPVLFVRGKVVSRALAPVRAVRVAVEVVRRGEVIARGEAVAGAIPTPEELWRSVDAAAIGALARAAASRAPRQVRPGDAVPFLVAIPDHPADLDGAAVRVEVAPAAGVAP